jgi:hypothetical protein
MIFRIIEAIANNLVRFGYSGFNLKNNAGVCEIRNTADDAMQKIRCASPSGNDDAATKGYVDPLVSAAAAAAASSIKYVRIVTGTNATYTSDTVIPANARLDSASFEVTDAYSAGTTISLGQVGSVALAMTTAETTPEVLGSKVVKNDQDVAWGAAALAALVTVNGAPAAGAGVAIFKYCSPLS